jgi:hypothetical protein
MYLRESTREWPSEQRKMVGTNRTNAKHPDKTLVGRISRGFDFPGDDFSPAGITGIVAFRSAKVALLSPAVWAIAPVPSRGDDRGYRQNGWIAFRVHSRLNMSLVIFQLSFVIVICMKMTND